MLEGGEIEEEKSIGINEEAAGSPGSVGGGDADALLAAKKSDLLAKIKADKKAKKRAKQIAAREKAQRAQEENGDRDEHQDDGGVGEEGARKEEC